MSCPVITAETPGSALALLGVYTEDARVRDGAAQELAPQRARQEHVRRVDGLAGDFLRALDPGYPPPDYAQRRHGPMQRYAEWSV